MMPNHLTRPKNGEADDPGLTCQDLDTLDCTDCGDPGHAHNPLYVTGHCHPGCPVYVAYFDGALSIFCVVCDAFVVRIKVAAS